jgi:hypothetical protein
MLDPDTCLTVGRATGTNFESRNRASQLETNNEVLFFHDLFAEDQDTDEEQVYT